MPSWHVNIYYIGSLCRPNLSICLGFGPFFLQFILAYLTKESFQTKVSSYLEEECVEDAGFDEDSCLNACLIEKFVADTECLHPRLEPLLKTHDVFERTEASAAQAVKCSYDYLRQYEKAMKMRTGKHMEPGKKYIPMLFI